MSFGLSVAMNEVNIQDLSFKCYALRQDNVDQAIECNKKLDTRYSSTSYNLKGKPAYFLGLIFEEEGDFNQAEMWWKKSISLGDLSAYYALNELYRKAEAEANKSIFDEVNNFISEAHDYIANFIDGTLGYLTNLVGVNDVESNEAL